MIFQLEKRYFRVVSNCDFIDRAQTNAWNVTVMFYEIHDLCNAMLLYIMVEHRRVRATFAHFQHSEIGSNSSVLVHAQVTELRFISHFGLCNRRLTAPRYFHVVEHRRVRATFAHFQHSEIGSNSSVLVHIYNTLVSCNFKPQDDRNRSIYSRTDRQ